MTIRRVLLPAVVMAAGFTVLNGCGGNGDTGWPDHPGKKIVVSFAPIYCFVANVAGDDAVVRNVMSGSGPHHFNPTDVEARMVQKADLFFINGLGIDDVKADSIKKSSRNRELAVIALGDAIPENRRLQGVCTHDHGHDHDHDHTDPHAWLAPDRAVLMVERVRDKLKEADPGHAADYDRRAAEYVVRLRKLQAEGRDQLKDKKDRNLVSFHDSLAYFADAFELKVVGVVQKTPGQEPNDDELRKLTEICTGTPKVRLIAVEPQYSTVTSAEEILKGLRRKGVADAAMVEIDPLETCLADDLTPDWYERKMRQNLQNLADKMK
jgi:ABC-type Zn uptake system ZnuABC Zn-binding protein ZnuA